MQVEVCGPSKRDSPYSQGAATLLLASSPTTCSWPPSIRAGFKSPLRYGSHCPGKPNLHSNTCCLSQMYEGLTAVSCGMRPAS